MSVTQLFPDDRDPTIANRYLAGQLSDAERAAFEAELERNPATLQELEATARLKVGLERLREEGQLDSMLRTSPSRRIVFAMAATLAVTLIGISLLLGYFRESPSRPLLAATPASFASAGVALPVAGTFAVFRKRQDSYDALIELPATPQAIQVRILPQLITGTERYRVSLARTGDERPPGEPMSVGGLTAESDGFVWVFIDATRLEPGSYRLALSADGETQDLTKAESFLINVVRAANP